MSELQRRLKFVYLFDILQSNLAIRNGLIRNLLVLRNHFPWPICHLLHKDKEHLALRNNFRATRKFLIAKFDCISTKSYLEKYNIFHLRSQHSENLMCLHNRHFWMWPHWTNWKLNQRSNWNSENIKQLSNYHMKKSYKPLPPAFCSWAEAKLIPTTATKSVALSILQLEMIGN